MIKNISGIILAGGAGTRFNGEIKSRIIFHGKSILTRIIEVYEQIFEEIIIVTNTPGEFTDFNRFLITGDLIPNRGPLGGIHAAMNSATNDILFVAAGDMPLLNKDLIRKQTEYFKEINCDILIPKIGESIEPLHGIYRKSLKESLEEFLNKNESCSVRDFLQGNNTRYMQLDQTEENAASFININSPEDMLRL
jgi:molybdenum cofactor guanylyltransferase